MELAANPFTRALANGDKQIGLWISLCSNFAAEVVSTAGYDWALIDMEHSANDYFSLIRVLASRNTCLPSPMGVSSKSAVRQTSPSIRIHMTA